MNFESDAFISYAHLDNVELIEGHKGWVSNLHRALEVRLAQLLGKEPQIWRDPKLQGNDSFADTLVGRLRRVAALVPVISPRYVKSEWTRKELSEFWQAAQKQGGVRFHDKVRIFKVLKTPIPLDMHPPELQALLGYEFFKIDPETGRVRELDEVFGADAQRDFWLKLDDLAHDICCLLESLEHPECATSSESSGEAVFLAETTSDLREQYEALRRDLQQHGYVVFPGRPLPSVASEVKAAVSEDLAKCQLSITLIGKNYSFVPEGGMESLLEIQNELAIERGKKGNFSRLLWIPPGLQVDDERQRKLIGQLRMDPRLLEGADLLETLLEDLRTVIHGRLKRAPAPTQQTSAPPSERGNPARLYVLYDRQDTEAASSWVKYLFEQGFEVMRPVFEGDEAEIREYHDENLRTCDGVLIFYGSANECWLRRKLREVQKSPGYGRTKPAPVVGISLAPPKTADKESFRTHEAMVIPQFDGFSPDALRQFVSSLQP
jgi:TIR domain-containing protein